VTAASVQDRDGGNWSGSESAFASTRLRRIWAAGAYPAIIAGTRWTGLAGWELVQQTSKGCAVQPKRWIVDRTFAGLGRYRRLSKDDERQTETSEAVIQVALIHLMLNRLGRT
jgi:putative transposase